MIFKPHQIKDKPLLSFQNILALVVVIGAFTYLFSVEGGAFEAAIFALITTIVLFSSFMQVICAKDEEIRLLHLEAKNLALKTAGVNIDHASGNTSVETIHTDNISGNIVADKLVVDDKK